MSKDLSNNCIRNNVHKHKKKKHTIENLNPGYRI